MFPRMDRVFVAMTAVKIHTIPCPRKCGWFRDWTERPGWDEEIVDHLIYGPVTEKELVQLDVRNHDCTESHNASIRLNKRRRENVARATGVSSS